MAKYERSFPGDLDAFVADIDATILSGSMSASLEDTSALVLGPVRVAVRVYERYSAFGGNRVSLNLTATEFEGWVHACAITSGGSEALFFKVNTVGEESFLDEAIRAIDAAADGGTWPPPVTP